MAGCGPVFFFGLLTTSKMAWLPYFQEVQCSPPPYPGAEQVTVSGYINGQMAVCGGNNAPWTFDGSNLCFSYTRSHQGISWVPLPNMTQPRLAAAASQHPDGMMVTGGRYDSGSTEMFVSGSWKAGITMPIPMIQHCQVTIGTTVVVIGNYLKGQKSAHSLEYGADSWKPLPNLKYPRCNHACAVLDDAIYVMGGHCSQGSSYKVEKYKLGWDKWEEIEADLPSPMTSGQAIVWRKRGDRTNNLYAITQDGIVYELENDKKWNLITDSLGEIDYHKRSHPVVTDIEPTGCGY